MVTKNKIGVVILNYESSNALSLTLKSLATMKNLLPFVVGVVNNGSKDADLAAEYYKNFTDTKPDSGFLFLQSEQNQGFSGGNNLMLKKMLADETITHFLLLNSDVIVPDYTFDRLVGLGLDAVGPVTNKAGNQQTIAIPFEPIFDETAIGSVNEIASERYQLYKDFTTETDMLIAYAVLFSRDLIERVGLLDERFFPGGFEDDDYCKRIIQKGYKLFIARGVYVHHWGSKSFSNIPISTRLLISSKNKELFEKKWGHTWIDRTHDPISSLMMDVNYLLTKENVRDFGLESINKGFIATIDFVKNQKRPLDTSQQDLNYRFDEKNQNLMNEKASGITTDNKINDFAYPKSILISQLCFKIRKKIISRVVGSSRTQSMTEKMVQKLGVRELTLDEIILQLLNKIPNKFIEYRDQKRFRQENKKLQESAMLESNSECKKSVEDDFHSIIDQINRGNSPLIAVFASYPHGELVKDGYYRRVLSVDSLLNVDGYTFYIADKPNLSAEHPVINEVNGKYEIHFNPNLPSHRDYVIELCNKCSTIYVHSILRIFPIVLDKIRTPKIIDFHGAVPEEADLYKDKLGFYLYSGDEEYAINNFDTFVFVTHTFLNHLAKKYNKIFENEIILPTIDFRDTLSTNNNFATNKRPFSFVYSGGTQKWQLVDETVDLIKKFPNLSIKFLTPNTDEVKQILIEKCVLNDYVIKSVSPTEMFQEYLECRYGLLLRDDLIVNRVACPTKLIEYLESGIIPILKFDDIGDFKQLGMQYVTVEEILEHGLPEYDRYLSMIQTNASVLRKLRQLFQAGANKLQKLINNPILSVKENIVDDAIGLVVTSFDRGGLEQVVFNLYTSYRKQNKRCYILCEEDKIGHFVGKIISPTDIYFYRKNPDLFLSYCERKNIKWLHYHYNTFLIDEMQKRGIRTIYTLHNVYTWLNDKEIVERSKKINSADLVVAVSMYIKDYYCKRTSTHRKHVHVIQNGINTEELDNLSLDSMFTRVGLGILHTDICLAFVASFHEVKHQMGMIGVMEKLIGNHPNVKLFFVGNIGHEEYYNSVKEAWTNSPAKGNIFHLPFIDHSQIGEFLRKTVDVFILPTIQEGCSNAVIEALYAGVPILMTDVGNAKDIFMYESVTVVSPTYEDLYELGQSEISHLCMQKNNRNTDEIVGKLSYIIDNLEEFKKAASEISLLQGKNLDSDTMAINYLKLMDI